jgi:hypothetical protein
MAEALDVVFGSEHQALAVVARVTWGALTGGEFAQVCQW